MGIAPLLAAALTACASSDANQQTPPVSVAMTADTPAAYDDGNLTLYQVQRPVPLPVRRPTDSESSALGDAPPPYPHAPFLRAEDERVLVHYTLSNVDDAPHAVWLLVDPWNEFVRWQPGITVVNDEESTPNFGYDLAFVVPGKSRIEGTLTPDDTHEIAIKLASAWNVIEQAKSQGQGFNATGLANHIFNPQNRSNSGDPQYAPWVPSVIAGLTGFDLGLRTNEAANVAIEITMDVTDLNGNRIVPAGQQQPQMGPPGDVLSPPGAR